MWHTKKPNPKKKKRVGKVIQGYVEEDLAIREGLFYGVE